MSNKKIFLMPTLAILTLFTGCSSDENCLTKIILKQSDIQQDSDYQKYEEMNENGQLSAQGEFIDTDIFDDSDDAEIIVNPIHVTFANNSYLKIHYYLDSDLSNEIDINNCYMNPGDSIYASAESINTNSNLYGISSYRIYDFSDELKKELSTSNADSNLVYTIPANYSGTEMEIIPVGDYPDRNLSMVVYYVDDSGTEFNLTNAGIWYINGEECIGNQTSISAIEPYVLKYDYDKENYFYVSSYPNCFTESPQEVGFIEFWEADPVDDDIDYSVELHPYISLSISLTEKGTVSLNDESANTVKKNKTWSSNKLKYGDEIIIETAGSCTLDDGDFEHVQCARDPITDGYRYTIKIAQEGSSDNESILSINHYVTLTLPAAGDYGECSYKLDGEKVSGTITLQESQKLEITYKITNSDYKFENYNAVNWFQDLTGDMTKTVKIDISEDMNNTTINPDDYFDIVSK